MAHISGLSPDNQIVTPKCAICFGHTAFSVTGISYTIDNVFFIPVSKWMCLFAIKLQAIPNVYINQISSSLVHLTLKKWPGETENSETLDILLKVSHCHV